MKEWPSNLLVEPGKATWLLHAPGTGVREMLDSLIRQARLDGTPVAWWDPEWRGYGTDEVCVDATASSGLVTLPRLLDAVASACPAETGGGLVVIGTVGLLPTTGPSEWLGWAEAAMGAARFYDHAIVLALQLYRSREGLDPTPFLDMGHAGLVASGGSVAVLS